MGFNQEKSRSFKRAYEERMIGGVCSGLANYFSFDAGIIRILYFGLTMITGFIPGVLMYALACIIIPSDDIDENGEPKNGPDPYDFIRYRDPAFDKEERWETP